MLLVKISVLFVYLILVFLIYHLLDFIALNNAELTGYFDPIKLSLQQIRSILFKDQFDQVHVKDISNLDNLGDTSTKQVKRHCYEFNSKNRLELVYTLENSKDVLLIQDDQNCRLSLQLLLNYQQLQTRHLHCVKWLPKWKIELNRKHLNDEEVALYTSFIFIKPPKILVNIN
uniref:Uncharacterized protein n=1 Tax=Ciona savignyi TaxID=51511 RepID=H2Z6G8_CIOSA